MINARFRMHGGTRLFLTLWFVVGGLVCAKIFVVSLRCLAFGWCRDVHNPEIGIATSTLLLAAGLAIVQMGHRLGRRDEIHLMEHLKRTVEAQGQ